MLVFKTREALAHESDLSRKLLTLPSENWRYASFRDSSGTLKYGLISSGVGTAVAKSVIEIYVPANAADAPATPAASRSVRLQMSAISYKNSALKFSFGSEPVSASARIPTDPDAKFLAYDNKLYAGLPSPETLMLYGEMFAVQSKIAQISLVFDNLSVGWNRIEITSSSPWILLSHEAQ